MYAITAHQLAAVNNEHLNFLQAQETVDSISDIIDSCVAGAKYYQDAINSLHFQMSFKDIAIHDRDSVIGLQQVFIHDQYKEIGRLKRHKTLLTIAGGALIAVASYLAIFH